MIVGWGWEDGKDERKGKLKKTVRENLRDFQGGKGVWGVPPTIFNPINLIPAALTSRPRLQERED